MATRTVRGNGSINFNFSGGTESIDAPALLRVINEAIGKLTGAPAHNVFGNGISLVNETDVKIPQVWQPHTAYYKGDRILFLGKTYEATDSCSGADSANRFRIHTAICFKSA
jgi:hypothetical protein